MDENNINEFTELQPGTGLNGGKYIIEKKIGEGGFGITYKAIQSGLDRPVCIKEYFPAGRCVRDTYARTIHIQGMDQDKFEKYRQSFVKEARTLAGLRHSSIVEVIDIFDENNTSYMVMPFIEGRSLQAIVDKEGPLTYPEAVNYMAQITDAVGYIHERHILHRDIKPDNIMITADYKAILIDFGSAREFVEDKTQAQTSMLTHGYAPTEQYTTTSRKGSYTDIYAIGATLYFILTGKVPMEAAARITEHMPEPRELRPDLPEEANRTIMKAMQMKAIDRHQTVEEFMDDLRNIRPSQAATATTSATAVPSRQVAAANPVTSVTSNKQSKVGLYIVLGIVAVAIVVALILALGGRTTAVDSHTETIASPAEQAPTPTDDSYNLDSQKLTDEDLRYMSKHELRLLRNEIFARHGYIFKSRDLQEHFNSKSWYHPITTSTYDVHLNSIEQYNINLIKQYE